MQDKTERHWVDWLGHERAQSYLSSKPNFSLEDSATWNQRLTAALLEEIGHVEIALRNRLNWGLQERLERRGVSGFWFDDPTGELVACGGQIILNRIEAARTQASHGKYLISESDLISELALGFWISFFASAFRRIHPDIIRLLYGRESRDMRNINDLASKFRRLRNRFAHNHRVIHRDLVRDLRVIRGFAHLVDPRLEAYLRASSKAFELVEEFSQTAQAEPLSNPHGPH